MIGTRPRTAWLKALTVRLGLDRNPLRRTLDRVGTAITATVVVAFLIGAPLAAAAASHAAHAAGLRVLQEQRAWHHVPAVLLETAPKEGSFVFQSAAFTWVHARWTAPDGAARVGEIPVTGGSRAGSTVWIWLNQAGAVVTAPLTAAQIAGREAVAVVIAPIVLIVVLLSGGAMAGRLVERRKLAAWEAAWETIEPQWSRRGN